MSFDFNFNSADKQQGDLIPDGVIVPVIMALRPGGAGEGGWLKPSKSSDALMLDVELTVTAGPYAKRKIFTNMVVSGGSVDDKGESKGGKITRSTLRAILESARNINPNDMSDSALRNRQIAGFGELNGIEFLMKVGIEKGQNGYEDKNKVKSVITPDMRQYAAGYTKEPVVSGPAATAAAPAFGGGGVPAPAATPAFAAPAQAASPTPPPAQPSEPTGNPAPAWAR